MSSITAKSVQGKRPEQEDRLVVLPCDDGYILAVCDGHCGHKTASMAITSLVEMSMQYASQHGSLALPSDAQDFLAAAVQRLVRETSSAESGSTLSLVHISEDAKRVDIAVLGDSPVVVWLDKENCWVSPEHNVRANTEDVRLAVQRGGSIRGAYLFADPLGSGLQLTRALGDADFSAVLQREAEYFSFPLGDQSVVAVMSDGVYDANFVLGKADLQSLPHASAGAIVGGALLRGSRDNVSAIVWRAR